MNAEIIAVGSELLLGQIANTNAQFISEYLAEMGVDVYYHTVVGDNEQRLLDALNVAEKRASLIILTGGLGPTKDDLTKETVSKRLGIPLIYDEPSLNFIKGYYQKVNKEMPQNNKKQALVLEGAHVLKNDYGMAPGMALNYHDHYYLLLPGPPSEMKPMVLNYVVPYVKEQLKMEEMIKSRVLRFFGIGESKLEEDILDLLEMQKNPTIAPLAKSGEVTLRLTAKGKERNEIDENLDHLEQKIHARVGNYFYGYGETTLPIELMKKLTESKQTIAAAESLTGGLFSQWISAISGASSVFKGSIVSYSNEVKMTVLGVPTDLIEKHGVVSEQCAKAMAEKVRKISNTDIGISFTGVAGPEALEDHEPGTVYVGLSIRNQQTEAFSLKLSGTREMIRRYSANYGCYILLKRLFKKS
ncbi:competence/damage-inducible protein A [Bacillus carboniphilus]|uniref:Putative competence-damage inducible protein n=1 Tax=Bacillus carboniphilus TaxID=86663 RepID=A0ABY9JVS1_9BACI|nr:competence/damage-inducible protein A [Bacillus carboniphilus]WLR43480.1 competence/damage-inducible protein A [Bacillus carboniphilus]